MANKDAAFGLKPIGKVGQNRDSQGLSEYDIAASATAIYFQDPVGMAATGTITVAAAGGVLLGSLGGVFFTDASTSKPTYANHLDASAQTDIGNVANIVYAAGSSPDYVSKVELDDSDLATSDGQLKVIGLSKDPDNSDLTSANVNWVVTINEHFLKQEAGV